eukprot:2674862-Prymnesium_polylepis.1
MLKLEGGHKFQSGNTPRRDATGQLSVPGKGSAVVAKELLYIAPHAKVIRHPQDLEGVFDCLGPAAKRGFGPHRPLVEGCLVVQRPPDLGGSNEV